MIDIHTMVPAPAVSFITAPTTPWKIRPETNTEMQQLLMFQIAQK